MGGRRKWPLAWAWLVCRVPDEEMRRMIGLDAFMLLRFLRMWRSLFLRGVIFGTVVLIPTYKTGAKKQSGFYQLTMRNLKRGSERLWAPVCFAYFWTVLVLRAVEVESSHYLKWRLEYLAAMNDDPDLQAKCSVLVERLPERLRSSSALAAYFGLLVGPDHVFSAVVYVDIRDLDAKVKLCDRLAQQYRRALTAKRRQPELIFRLAAALDAADAALAAARDRVLAVEAEHISRVKGEANEAKASAQAPVPSLKRGYFESKIAEFEKSQLGLSSGAEENEPLGSTRNVLGDLLVEPTLDAADHLARVAVGASQATVGGLAATLALDDALSTAYRPSSTGVVTLSDPGTAADIVQIALTSQPLGLQVFRAPPPSDLAWRNVASAASAVELREQIADLSLWLVAMLFFPIVLFFQAMSNLKEIARIIKPLQPFVKNDKYEYLRTLVTGYVPVVLLLGLLAIVPIGLDFLAMNYVGHKSHAAVERYITSRHLYFQLLTLLVTVLGGSLASVLKDFIQHPTSLLNLLGQSLPNISAYFLQTVIVKTLFSLPFELSRPIPYFSTSATRKYHRLVKQQQATYRPLPPDFRIGYQVPSILMVALIGTLYAPIAPIIIFAAFIYFAFAIPIFARQFLFVYVSTHEAGALYLWPFLTFFVSLALIITHCTLISYIIILNGVRQASFLAPLPFATFIFYRRLVNLYERPARVVDRESAVANHLYDANRFRHMLIESHYRHPALMVHSYSTADIRAGLDDQEEDDADQDCVLGEGRSSDAAPDRPSITYNPAAFCNSGQNEMKLADEGAPEIL